MLQLFLIQFVLQFLVYGTNAECAIGDVNKNANWIKSNGRLKYNDIRIDRDAENDDYLLLQVTCSERPDDDDSEELCNCIFTNSSGGIFSCFGDIVETLPNPRSHIPVERLRLYAVRHAKRVQIKSHQFSGHRTNEIRLENIQVLQMEDRAFEGVQDLATLRLSHNNFGEMGYPDLIFAGLVNLTTLDLSYSNITGWKSGGKTRSNEPILPKLLTLDLTGNPLGHLHNDTFEWLRGSRLQYLILQKCNIQYIDTGTLDPIRSTLRTIDVGDSKISVAWILKLVNQLGHKSSIRGMALSSIGLMDIPYEILLVTSGTLQYLSLHGNPFRNLSKDNLRKRKKKIQQLAQENSTLTVDQSMVLNTPDKVFPDMPKLEELDLSKCSIYYIEKDTLGAMPQLRSLLLSHNQLVRFNTLNSPAFSQLLYLDLSYNPLNLNTLNLTSFPVLTTLDLSYTNGRRIFKNTFQNSSTKLKKLSICYSELSYIADNAFTSLYKLNVLDLQGNRNLGKHLSMGTFNGLTSLEELHLAECTQKVESRTFSQLNTKSEMDPLQKPISLKENNSAKDGSTSEIEMDALQKLTSLKRINLANNGITCITSKTVDMLPQLESLDLSNNYIRSWNEPLFTNTSLRNLNVANNHFNYITDAMLQDFRSLSTVIILSNPFVCHCNCRKFLELATNITESSESNQENPPDIEIRTYEPQTGSTNDKHKIRQTKSGFKAMYPPGDGTNDFIQHWDEDDGDDEYDGYVCLNQTDSNEMNYISFKKVSCDPKQGQTPSPGTEDDGEYYTNPMTSSEQVAITAVAAVLIITIAIGITYWKWWYIRYFAILVKNATVLSFMSHDENASTDKIFNYDIFISYSDHDREWVLNSLLPNLESKSKVNVCLHERDFQVGISILENIISSMDRSRCILLVISQSFLRSQWCQFELHLAQHRLLETRREELILLFLEEIPKMKRPKTLQYLMRTKTYILWPKRNDDVEGQKLFWKRLLHATLRNTAETERKQISIV